MMQFIDLLSSQSFWFTVIKLSTPILFAAMGAHIALKAGLINIGLEGIMLVGAFVGIWISGGLHQLGVGDTLALLVSFVIIIMVGLASGLFIGYFHLKMDSDIGITGLAFNMIASGLTVFSLFALTGDKGASYTYKSLTFPYLDIPVIKDIPYIGNILSGHNLITYLAFILLLVLNFVMAKTTIGLRIKATGENPHAVQSIGISVVKIQLSTMAISGGFAAIGGAFLSMAYVPYFIPEMTAGRGFIALTANTMGVTPIGLMLVSVMFGFADALGISLQIFSKIPTQFIGMLPYVITIVALVISSYRKKLKHGDYEG